MTWFQSLSRPEEPFHLVWACDIFIYEGFCGAAYERDTVVTTRNIPLKVERCQLCSFDTREVRDGHNDVFKYLYGDDDS